MMIQLKPICKMIRSDSQIDSFTKDVKLASFLNSPTPYRQISMKKIDVKLENLEKRTITPVASILHVNPLDS